MLHNKKKSDIMPPKPKYTKEEVIKAGFEMVRKIGFSSLTARDLSKRLVISARPIFTAFVNMEEPITEVIKTAIVYLEEYFKEFTNIHPHLSKWECISYLLHKKSQSFLSCFLQITSPLQIKRLTP